MSNFLYNVVVNDWDETTYVPTLAGNILLAIVIIALLIGAVIFASKARSGAESAKSKLSPRQLAFCAMAIALGTVFSMIKLFHFPTGGSITLLSMLIITLPGYFFGVGAGLMAAIAYGILQLLIDPYVLFPMQLVVDYILAFGALGLSGLFAKSSNGLTKGYIVGVIGRFIFAVISGWIFFGSYAWEGWGALPYSLAYNAIYIFSEAVITLIVINIPAVKNAITMIKNQANS